MHGNKLSKLFNFEDPNRMYMHNLTWKVDNTKLTGTATFRAKNTNAQKKITQIYNQIRKQYKLPDGVITMRVWKVQ